MSFEETPENDSEYLDDEFDNIAKSRANQTRRTTFVVQLQRKSLTSEEIKKKGGGLMNLLSGLKVKLSILQRFELLLKILRNRKKPKQDGEITDPGEEFETLKKQPYSFRFYQTIDVLLEQMIVQDQRSFYLHHVQWYFKQLHQEDWINAPNCEGMKRLLERWMAIVDEKEEASEVTQQPPIPMTNRERKKRKGPLDRSLKKSISNGFLGKLFCMSRNNSTAKSGQEGSKSTGREANPVATAPVRKSTATSFFSCTSPKSPSVVIKDPLSLNQSKVEEPMIIRSSTKPPGQTEQAKEPIFETIDEL